MLGIALRIFHSSLLVMPLKQIQQTDSHLTDEKYEAQRAYLTKVLQFAKEYNQLFEPMILKSIFLIMPVYFLCLVAYVFVAYVCIYEHINCFLNLAWLIYTVNSGLLNYNCSVT